MAIFEIISSRGGLSDHEDKGIPGSFKFGSNLDIRKRTDSLSCRQDLADEGLDSGRSPSLSPSPSGSVSKSPSPSPSASPSPTDSESASESPSVSVSLSPSITPSHTPSPSPSASAGLTTVFEGLIHWFVKASDGYTYGFDNVGNIYRRDADGYWDRVYTDPGGAILGAWEWYSETGATYLYWATLRTLHRKQLPGRHDWNDVDEDATWPKTNLTAAEWHTMREAGGALVIANGPWLAMVGYDDSYTNEALNLIPGNIAKTIVERNGRSIIGTTRVSNQDRSINAAIDSEYPLAQVGDDGELFFANMVDSMSSKRFPGGGKVNPGGVCNEIDQVNFFEWEQIALSWIDKQSIGNMALFAVFDADAGKGGIYSYGRKNKNHPFVLNLDHLLDMDELGAVTNVNGTTLVSYRDGAGFGVKATDPSNKAIAVYEGLDLRSPAKKPAEITNWKYAEVFCKPLPTGTSIEFWYKRNKTGNFVQARMEGDFAPFQADGEWRGTFLVGIEAEIFEPRVVLNPYLNTGPEVHRTEIYFEDKHG